MKHCDKSAAPISKPGAHTHTHMESESNVAYVAASSPPTTPRLTCHELPQLQKPVSLETARCCTCASAAWAVLKTLCVLLACVGALSNLYMFIKVGPILGEIHAVAQKASIMYKLVYYFGCDASQIIPAADCALLHA